MELMKTEIFTDKQNRIANLAKAFAHPAQVPVFQLLIEKKACVCGDLVNEPNLAQATVSQQTSKGVEAHPVSFRVKLTRPVCVGSKRPNWRLVAY